MAFASTTALALVSPLFKTTFDTLQSLIIKEVGLVLGVREELDKLYSTWSIIQTVIEDAELRQTDNKMIHIWLNNLKDLVYEADDIIDDCATEFGPPGTLGFQQTISHWLPYYCDPRRIALRRSTATRIKKLVKKFDELAKQRINLHLASNPTTVGPQRMEGQRETSSFLSVPQVYGRESENQDIVNLLLERTKENDVNVCCIVGMGGLGKTTLAQLVYNDEKIENHFNLRCWVHVQTALDLKSIFKSILECAHKKIPKGQDLDTLQRAVREALLGKKFLLVLDNVRDVSQAIWSSLNLLLQQAEPGSSVIVTTRLEQVASTVANLPIQRPTVLTDENSWSLFKSQAFCLDGNDYHPNLEAIGRDILMKCAGAPLATKALGGMLRFKRDPTEWEHVRDNQIWDLPQDKDDGILPVLRLSYNNLSPESRQCFSYCAVYPKYYIMEKELLVQIWIANGFVEAKGSMQLEDAGNAIFNELLLRSFFLPERSKDGLVTHAKMHDLFHDLASSISVNECSFIMSFMEFKGTIRQFQPMFCIHVNNFPNLKYPCAQFSNCIQDVCSSREIFLGVFPSRN